MQYKITFSKPTQHLIHISLKIEVSSKDKETFYLPMWRPGRYEAANYSKNILGFMATHEKGTPLSWIKKTAHQWEIDTKNADEITISYSYFAHAMDAGNSWYDDELIYINFINCLMFTQESLGDSCIVDIDIPDNYQIATSLDYQDKQLLADNYHDLVDSPIVASEKLSHIDYTVDSTVFNIWVYGIHDLNLKKVKADFERFSKSQIDCFGEFPEKEYHFLLLALPNKFYHGVEHGASTVICLGPGKEMSSKALYTSLLGVSSHELFHAWNIIKIRPKEMQPYDFSKSITFNTGYVAEGFTTYYGDLFLSRSNVFDIEAYFNELNTIFNRHFWNYGRLNESVMTSSANLWVDGYEAGAPNKKSSIYVEGAMIALCLDLKLREATSNNKSLDDIMRLLWKNHGKTQTGYSHLDLLNYAERVANRSFSDFFEKYISGTADKDTLLNECLNVVGCKITTTPNEKLLHGALGLRTVDEDAGLRVISIAPGSVGEDLFSINDVIVEINNEKAGDIAHGINTTLKVERYGKQLSFEISADNVKSSTFYPNYKICKQESASDSQKKAFELWCGQIF